ncbi:TPA: helix-turn-helix domain-containing protein [Enterobacter kobei]|uniref:winged helix-turn-helix domain-containing protein n=1 Tax=Enterobacter kobei TaxID=208224 RepID=UPI0032AF71FB|nr:helix-turn-helix domain-containing protein [Enterobacter kobei]HDC4552113.1 helix-turn-helix domain-containing protein [Enterobacter kobei]
MQRIDMRYEMYGFLLDGKILFDIGNRKILHYSFEEPDLPIFIKVVSLNETQARLLRFLLMNRNVPVIERTDIMQCVWDVWNLSSSNQRLWQSINSLRKKLASFGLSDDLIKNVHGMGYSVDETRVLSLVIK